MTLTDFTSSFSSCMQMAVAVALFAWSLPRREPRAARMAAAVAILAAWSALTATLLPLNIIMSEPVPFACFFMLTLGMLLGLTIFMFKISVWAAGFCATAGYTMQNLASGLSSSFFEFVPSLKGDTMWQIAVTASIVAAVYTICYALLVSRIRRNGLELVQPQAILAMIVAVILAVIAFDVVVKQLHACNVPLPLVAGCRGAHALMCIFVLVLEYETLYNRRLLEEVAAVSRTMESEREQYQLSKETIEAINIKCHDIRHQIRSLGDEKRVDQDVLDSIAAEVRVYDSAVHTGNEPLDVILTEKGLTCSRENITLSCIADGACLAFVKPSDLYSLVGNALDNAIEAVRALPDPEHRSIGVWIRRAGGMAAIHMENYFAGELSFEGDLPKTTKADKNAHGFGMKSMRLVAERYGGTLHTRVQGDVFHLNVAIPIPEEG